MDKLKSLFVTPLVVVSSTVFAVPVEYDAADALASITNIGTTAVAVMGAFITLAITIMFYRKIRGVVSKG